jgi:tetratricopeptide (TPR) repeat protein
LIFWGQRVDQQLVRIDGWKAIAGHFRRDRTTVMRWARDRDLPVKRVPGGSKGSVYAFAQELDQWLAKTGNLDSDALPALETPPAEQTLPQTVPRLPLWRRPLSLVLGALGLAAIAAVSLPWSPKPRAAMVAALLPADPAVAALYLQARDDWAARTADSLHKAVTGFGAVISRDPRFAPAYTGLADAYLLVREFDAMPDAQAYGQAEAAAKAALAIDPNNAEAHRALGFIAYWWKLDNKAAGAAFQRALSLDPKSAQTRFWYGNVLVDNGEFAAGLEQLDHARLLDPGSFAITADYGWALWSAGARPRAKALLTDLDRTGTASAGPSTYLSYIYFAEKNFPAYLAASARRAARRADPAMQARALAEQAAFARGGSAALLAAMSAAALKDYDSGAAPEASWAALVASQAGDRRQLIELLRRAESRHERWGMRGLAKPIFAQWQTDAALFDRLAARMETLRLQP